MFENRDDTLPRPVQILDHFKRNIEHEAKSKVREAFKEAWGPVCKINCPTQFKVNVAFGRILPQDILTSINNELIDHGWKNFQFEVADDQHVLLVKLVEEEAAKYARP